MHDQRVRKLDPPDKRIGHREDRAQKGTLEHASLRHLRGPAHKRLMGVAHIERLPVGDDKVAQAVPIRRGDAHGNCLVKVAMTRVPVPRRATAALELHGDEGAGAQGKHIGKKHVVAVPALGPVVLDAHDEQVASGKPLRHGRSLRPAHAREGGGERGAERVHDRRLDEEVALIGRKPQEDLLKEVVTHAGADLVDIGMRTIAAQHGDKTAARRPAVRVRLDAGKGFGRVGLRYGKGVIACGAGTREKLDLLVLGEPQVVLIDGHEPPLHAQARELQDKRAARGHKQVQVGREVLQKVLHALGNPGHVLHGMKIVEHQGNLARQRPHGDDKAVHSIVEPRGVIGKAQVGKRLYERGVRLAQ